MMLRVYLVAAALLAEAASSPNDRAHRQRRALRAESTLLQADNVNPSEAVAAGYARARSFKSADLASLLPAEGERPAIPPGYMEAVVCPSAGLFFIHVYKAAGVTVTAAIDRECNNATDAATTGAICMMHEYGSCADASSDCSCGETMYMRQPRTLFATNEPTAVTAARGSGFFFTLVRDPMDKLISAMSELDLRGDLGVSLNASDPLDHVLSRIRAEGFFNAHLWPSSFFLVDPLRSSTAERLVKLPMDFIGTAEQSGAALAWVHWRLGRSTAHSTPDDWLAEVHGRGAEESAAERLNDHGDGRHTDLSTRIHPTVAQLREVCRLYRIDYVALQLPHPSACDDMLS